MAEGVEYGYRVQYLFTEVVGFEGDFRAFFRLKSVTVTFYDTAGPGSDDPKHDGSTPA